MTSNSSSITSVPPRPVIVGRHYPQLDGIRGIAILLVLLFHCASRIRPHTLTQELYFTAASGGWVGVDLFFVLSGFNGTFPRIVCPCAYTILIWLQESQRILSCWMDSRR